MDLKIKDVVELLQVSEKTVYRWIKEKKIPCYRINHQYRFNRSELNEWVLSNRIELSSKMVEMALAKRPTNLADLTSQGGIYYNVPGITMKDVMTHVSEIIKLPGNISRQELLFALINREEMMSTAIGRGIAIPHPRNPLVTNMTDACVSICLLQNPIEFGALDGKPVHTLFVVLTYNPRRHLQVLSKISYMCQIEEFTDLLEARASEEKIISFITEKEQEWAEKEGAAL